MVHLGNDWDAVLTGEFDNPYYIQLRTLLADEYRRGTVYPDMHAIFNALKLTPYADTKVVILGQDPYHGAGQAHGLAFSVQPGIAIPPSLLNIYKELQSDCSCYMPTTGNLEKWAAQGVLLLNTSLTVRESQPNSHQNIGWNIFTDRIISLLAARSDQGLVYMLWGANARSKLPLIGDTGAKVLTAPHPSPLSASRGFFGCKHFSKANEYLRSIGKSEIDWQI